MCLQSVALVDQARVIYHQGERQTGHEDDRQREQPGDRRRQHGEGQTEIDVSNCGRIRLSSRLNVISESASSAAATSPLARRDRSLCPRYQAMARVAAISRDDRGNQRHEDIREIDMERRGGPGERSAPGEKVHHRIGGPEDRREHERISCPFAGRLVEMRKS